MSDEPTPPEVTPPEQSDQAEQEPDKYTPEWYDSVEKRFKDLGDFIRSGRATHSHGPTPKPARSQASAQVDAGEPAPDAAPTGQDTGNGSAPARDIRPPRPNHFWFRRLGGD